LTKSYYTSENTVYPSPFSPNSVRTLEYTVHGAGFNVMLYIDDNQELIYAYGADDSWTLQAVTGGGMTGYGAADIFYCAMKVCPVNEYVHITFVADNKIFYCRLDDPDDPTTAGKWHDFADANMGIGAAKYQRVDDSSNAKHNSSITVDEQGPGMNGMNIPHIAWSESVGGTYAVFYNLGDQQPPTNDAFNNVRAMQLDADGDDVCIFNCRNEGREPSVFWLNDIGEVESMRCSSMNYPMVLANWNGHEWMNGPNVADTVLTFAGWGPTAITSFSVTYAWDNEVNISVVGVISGDSAVSNYFVGNAQPAVWNGQAPLVGYTGDPDIATVTNFQGLSQYRCLVINEDNEVWHCVVELNNNQDIVWTANDPWYQLSDIAIENSELLKPEWRTLEHDDVNEVYNRSSAAWMKNTDTEIWFSVVRENTPPVPILSEPVNGATLDELSTIRLGWTVSDTESDTQDDYAIQADEDDDYGSPEVDTGWIGPGTTALFKDVAGSTFSAGEVYYWHVKLKDNEMGDDNGTEVYDPRSEGVYNSPDFYFYTTPQLQIGHRGYALQGDQDLDIFLNFICAMDVGEDLTNAELDDGIVTDYAQYRYNTISMGDMSAWTNMDIREADCTEDPDGHDGGDDGLPTSRGSGDSYTLVWDMDSDLNGLQTDDFVGWIEYRIRGQYFNDSKSMGFTDWNRYSTPIWIDLKAPEVEALWPDGDDLADTYPILRAAISDDSTWESQFELDTDPGFGSVEAGHDSGWVTGALTYTPTTELSVGVWYWRVTARDTFDPTNNTATDGKQFEIKNAGFVPAILDDGSTTVTLKIINDIEVAMQNALVEYENIRNDFDETDTLQNIPEYRGHNPLTIGMEVLFTGGNENQTDVKQIHTWQRDETKLTLTDSIGLPLTIGTGALTGGVYAPNKFKVTVLTPNYRPGIIGSFIYNITIREVPA